MEFDCLKLPTALRRPVDSPISLPVSGNLAPISPLSSVGNILRAHVWCSCLFRFLLMEERWKGDLRLGNSNDLFHDFPCECDIGDDAARTSTKLVTYGYKCRCTCSQNHNSPQVSAIRRRPTTAASRSKLIWVGGCKLRDGKGMKTAYYLSKKICVPEHPRYPWLPHRRVP